MSKAGTKKWGTVAPSLIDSEQGALCILLTAGTGSTNRAEITTEHFYTPLYAAIFGAMLALDADGTPWDLVILTKYMHEQKMFSSGNDVVTLSTLYTDQRFSRSEALLEQYCQDLEEARKLRAQQQIYTRALAAIHEPSTVADTLYAETKASLDAAFHGQTTNDSVTEEACHGVLAQVKRVAEGGGKPLGIYTGVPAYDSALGGLFPSCMDVIGARPKVGKTSAIETMIDSMLDCEMAVSVFQKDMSVETMIGRMACRRALAVYEDFIIGTMDAPTLHRVKMEVRRLLKLKHLLRIHNPANLTATSLGAIVAKDKDRHGVRGFFLDQFQKLRVDRMNRVDGLTEASIEIRHIIDRTKLPGVIVAQISKEADKEGRPHAGMFKYCDQLFSDADRIILLWSRDDPKGLEVNEHQDVEFTVDANRMGAPSDNRMKFHRELMTFHPGE